MNRVAEASNNASAPPSVTLERVVEKLELSEDEELKNHAKYMEYLKEAKSQGTDVWYEGAKQTHNTPQEKQVTIFSALFAAPNWAPCSLHYTLDYWLIQNEVLAKNK